MAEAGELLARRPVAKLRLVAEGEEGLPAAGPLAGLRDREHLLGGEIGGPEPARCLRERAVVTDVAAELGERDEHLRREGHDAGVARVADAGGSAEQGVEVGPVDVEKLERFFRARLPASSPRGDARVRSVAGGRSSEAGRPSPAVRGAGRILRLDRHWLLRLRSVRDPASGLRVPHRVSRGVVARGVRDRTACRGRT